MGKSVQKPRDYDDNRPLIGVDPYYLTYQAEKFGHHPEVILAGRRINDGMGKYIAEQTVKNMVKTRGSLNGGVVDIIREWKEYGLSFHIHDLQADRPRSRASRIPRHAD